MEKATAFTGQIDIDPRLTKDEIERVNVFPRMTPVAGHPETPCGWVASAGGRKLTLRDGSCEATAWLRLIVKSFRAPRPVGRFDGLVVGRRYAPNELFTIHVRGNRVTERELWPRSSTLREPGKAEPPPTPVAQVIDLASRRVGGR